MKKNTLVCLISIAFLTSSCLMTKTNVGNYSQTQGKEYTYAKGKQFWLLWFFPMGRTNVKTPSDGNCQVVTRFKFVDYLISGFTLGIVRTYSIDVKVKKEESNNIRTKKAKQYNKKAESEKPE